MKEVWKDIKDFEGHYQISNKGQVKSLDRNFVDNLGRKCVKHGKVLKLYEGKAGYYVVDLRKNNKRKMAKVHRLVAQEFIPNPENKEQINHKDGVKTNNILSNLEWSTPSDNLKHAYDNKLLIPHLLGQYGIKHPRHKKVKQIKETKVIKIFDGITEAARQTNLSQGNISEVCLGHRKTAGGFIWRYA